MSAAKPLSPLVAESDALTKLLEMELELKRAAWQRSRSQRGIWRALSLLFLVLVFAGAVMAWFYLSPALSGSGRAASSSAIEKTGSTR